MTKKTRKQYTPEFRAQAVELVLAGRRVLEVARDFEIETSCLYAWVRKAKKQSDQLGSERIQAEGEESEADELIRLRRENEELRLDNAILKKAAIILGTNPPSNDAK